MEITYYLNGADIKDYGVFVSKSDGLLGRPKPKKTFTVSWAEHHGEVVDLEKRYYESRKITLDCFIKADNKEDFILKLNAFLAVLDATGTQRLMVAVDPARPLVYEVFFAGNIEPKKTWSDVTMVGTFQIELIEPAPIKRVLKKVKKDGATADIAITLTSARLLDIFWGDGTATRDISGTGETVEHTYTANGTYYIVMAGNIDEITGFSVDGGTVLWNKL